jgi:iron complex outermembrane receptor protein
MRPTQTSLAVAALVLLWPGIGAHAQPRLDAPAAEGAAGAPQSSRRGSGTFVGVVTAPDEARLPGTTITLTNLDTGSTVVIVTAGHGGYTGSDVAAGNYTLTAELPGFETQSVSSVVLSPGEVREINFQMPLSTMSETVEVRHSAVRNTVEASEIRETPARDVGQALARMPGVVQVRKGAIGNDVIVRGLESRDLTILIDGERIYGACPSGMDPGLLHVDFAEVDRVEVTKGPFDVRHQGSLGGVVNVITRAPGTGAHGTADVSGGSYRYVNPSATASFGNSLASVLGGFSYKSSKPYRDGSDRLFTEGAGYRPSAVDSRAFDVNTGWGRLFLSPGMNQVMQVAYTRQETSHMLTPFLTMDAVGDDVNRAKARYETLADGTTVSAQAYYTSVSHWMTDEFRISSAAAPRSYSMGAQADTSALGGDFAVSRGSLSVGAEAFRRTWDTTRRVAGSGYVTLVAIPDVHTDSLGGWGEYGKALSENTRLEVGGRLDWAHSVANPATANTNLFFAYKGTRNTSATDVGASGKIQLVSRLGDDVRLDVSFGRAFRVPDPQERYYAAQKMGSDWVGNPALRPTVNTGINVNATYNAHRLVASGGLYYNRLTDFIVVHQQVRINVVPGIANQVARSYENVNARIRGAEATLTYSVTDRLFATVDATYTRGTKDLDLARAITNPNMAEMHPPTASMRLRYDRAVVFGEVDVRVSARHELVDTDLQEQQMPGYGILNVRMGGQKAKLRATFAIDNLLNKAYVQCMSYQRDPFRSGFQVNEPGRNLYTNISYRF